MHKKGDIIKFGNIDWQILKVKKNKMLVISEKILGQRPFDSQGETNEWENCSLNKYLNTDFISKNFCPDEQEKMTQKGLFLLSIKQAYKYMPKRSVTVACDEHGNIGWWWLRTPGSFTNCSIAIITSKGDVNIAGWSADGFTGGVRPAMWLKI